MIPYRLYQLRDGHIAGPAAEVEFENDAMAIAAAFGRFKDAVAVEVWSGARKVARLTAEELRQGSPSPYSTAIDQRIASPVLRP